VHSLFLTNLSLLAIFLDFCECNQGPAMVLHLSPHVEKAAAKSLYWAKRTKPLRA
jgi:hypothetical protein